MVLPDGSHNHLAGVKNEEGLPVNIQQSNPDGVMCFGKAFAKATTGHFDVQPDGAMEMRDAEGCLWAELSFRQS